MFLLSFQMSEATRTTTLLDHIICTAPWSFIWGVYFMNIHKYFFSRYVFTERNVPVVHGTYGTCDLTSGFSHWFFKCFFQVPSGCWASSWAYLWQKKKKTLHIDGGRQQYTKLAHFTVYLEVVSVTVEKEIELGRELCVTLLHVLSETQIWRRQGVQGVPGTKVFQDVYFWELVRAYLVDCCTDLTDCNLDLKCLRKMELRT